MNLDRMGSANPASPLCTEDASEWTVFGWIGGPTSQPRMKEFNESGAPVSTFRTIQHM